METLSLTEPNPFFIPYQNNPDDNLTVEKLEAAIRLVGERLQSEYMIIKLGYPEMKIAKLNPKMGKILFESVVNTEQAEQLHKEFHDTEEQAK